MNEYMNEWVKKILIFLPVLIFRNTESFELESMPWKNPSNILQALNLSLAEFATTAAVNTIRQKIGGGGG